MLRKHENQWAKKTLEEKKEIYNFSNDYKLFLNSSKAFSLIVLFSFIIFSIFLV